MDDKQKAQISFVVLLTSPVAAWIIVAKLVYGVTPQTIRSTLATLIKETPHLWPLWSALLGGFVVGVIGLIAGFRLSKQTFAGARFERFYRGTQLVSAAALARETHEPKARQITIAGVPIPIKAETTHISLGGSTGVGKSTIFKEMMVGCLARKDRMVILDPDGEYLSTFYKKGDKILNPYDARSEGWSFFNEIREDFDFERYARSIVQQSDSANQIPSSTSPRTVHPSLPTLAGSGRPSHVPSDLPRTGHPSISIPSGGDERLLRSPPAANHSTPEPVRVDNTPSNQLPPLPPVAGTKVSKPARASKSLSEPPALAITANPIAVEPMEGQERLTRLSPIPLVATQPTILDSTPAPSSVAKKPGRPSNKSLGFIASTFTHLDEIIHDLASQTGMTRMQLIARWLGDAKGGIVGEIVARLSEGRSVIPGEHAQHDERDSQPLTSHLQ